MSWSHNKSQHKYLRQLIMRRFLMGRERSTTHKRIRPSRSHDLAIFHMCMYTSIPIQGFTRKHVHYEQPEWYIKSGYDLGLKDRPVDRPSILSVQAEIYRPCKEATYQSNVRNTLYPWSLSSFHCDVGARLTWFLVMLPVYLLQCSFFFSRAQLAFVLFAEARQLKSSSAHNLYWKHHRLDIASWIVNSHSHGNYEEHGRNHCDTEHPLFAFTSTSSRWHEIGTRKLDKTIRRWCWGHHTTNWRLKYFYMRCLLKSWRVQTI